MGFTRVLGRLSELRGESYKDEPRLDVHDSRWTYRINRAWIEEALQAGDAFRIVSLGDHRGSILEWEIDVVQQSGYVRKGNWLVSPGDAAAGPYELKVGAELQALQSLAPHFTTLAWDGELSTRMLIALRALPIHVLGVVDRNAWADGQWCSPREFFFHDVDHARYKIREDTLYAGFECPDPYEADESGQVSTFDVQTGKHRAVLQRVIHCAQEVSRKIWELAPERLAFAKRVFGAIDAMPVPVGKAAEILVFEIVHEKSLPMDEEIVIRELRHDAHVLKLKKKWRDGFYGSGTPSYETQRSLPAGRDRLLAVLESA